MLQPVRELHPTKQSPPGSLAAPPVLSENVSGLRYVDYFGKWVSFLPFGIDFYVLNVLWNTSMIC